MSKYTPHLIVSVEYLWWGVSIGGEHYTMDMVGTTIDGEWKKIELDHELSTKEIIHLNKKEKSYGAGYEKGDRSTRFETPEQGYAVAMSEYKKHFPDAVVLRTGSSAVCDPKRVLDAPEWFKTATNKLAQKFIDIDGYEGDDAEADKIYRKYTKLTDKLIEEYENGK